MRGGRVLRKIVMDRIIAQVPALGGRVYDKATEGTVDPYVTLGPSYWNDNSADCIKGRLQTLQIDVWADQSNKGRLEDVVDDIAAALDGWADTEALTMHPLAVSMARVMDDPSGAVHGVIQVEALLENGPTQPED